MRGRSGHDARHVALVDNLTQPWEQISSAADTDGDGRVSREEWKTWAGGMLDFLVQTMSAGEPWPLDGWIDTLYGVIGADGDGHITVDEYRDWLTVLRLADGMDVDAVFAGFDTNGDGCLSRDEFAAVTRDHWTNFDDGIPAHHWLGG